MGQAGGDSAVEEGERIREGMPVLLYGAGGKTWLIRVRGGQRVHTHLGYLDGERIIGQLYGRSIETSLGHTVWALRPTLYDFVMKSERRTQVVYPKDAGLILARTGVGAGSTVVEVGTGSGALTMVLANAVKPTGRVYSFEIRPEFLAVASRNLERAGLNAFVTLRVWDPREGLQVRGAEAAVVDVGDPWSVLPSVVAALKGGGVLAAVCPTMNQVERLVGALRGEGLVDVDTVEVLLRHLEAREGRTRPATRMVGHTAYLTFARRVLSGAPATALLERNCE